MVYLGRRGLRAGRGGWILVAGLTALTLTVSAGALTVARQTLDAHPRLLDAIGAPDVTVGIGNPDDPDPRRFVEPDQLRTLPDVARVAVERNTIGTEVDADDRFVPDSSTGLIVAVDGAPALPLLRGRLPSPEAPNEVTISDGAVDALHADVGTLIRYAVASWSEYEEIASSGADHGGTVVELTVVGVTGPTALDGPADAPTKSSVIRAGRAFFDVQPDIGTYQVASVWLRDENAAPGFLRALEARFGQGLDIQPRARNEAAVRQAVQPDAYALAGFALAAGIAGLIITAQAIGRQLASGNDELVLVAIGMSRRQRTAARWGQAGVAVAAGIALGLLGGVVAGRAWGAIGIARAFDVAVTPPPALTPVVGTAGAIAGVLLAAAAVSAWGAARIDRGPHPAGSSWTTGLRNLAPLSVRTGAALSGKGTGTARAARAAVAGTATSVVVIVGVITFGSSLDRLVATPALYGHDYDLAAWDNYNVLPDDAITAALQSDADIVGIGRVAGSSGTVNGREADLSGYDDLRVGPRLTDGDLPRDGGEVLLGRRLAHRLGVGRGDEVVVAVGATRERFTVVGTGVAPSGRGDGAAFTLDGLHRVAPAAEIGGQYVRLAPGVDRDVVVSHYLEALSCPQECELTPPEPPSDLIYLDSVGELPRLSAAAMLGVGIAMTIHALVIVGRRNRRTLAVLRAIGATRRQVTGFLVGQAVLLLAAATVAGVALGVVVGRVVWRILADELGVVPEPRASAGAIAAAVAALVILAIAVAALPSWRAARRPAADALRAD